MASRKKTNISKGSKEIIYYLYVNWTMNARSESKTTLRLKYVVGSNFCWTDTKRFGLFTERWRPQHIFY